MSGASDSILTSTKKVLGIAEDYDIFDLDITMHINSALATLTQLGIGPQDGFSIEDASATWDNFLDPTIATSVKLNPVRTYIYLRVRMIFDPPATSFTQDAFQKQIQELEWRLNVMLDPEDPDEFIYEGGSAYDTDQTDVVVYDGGTP